MRIRPLDFKEAVLINPRWRPGRVQSPPKVLGVNHLHCSEPGWLSRNKEQHLPWGKHRGWGQGIGAEEFRDLQAVPYSGGKMPEQHPFSCRHLGMSPGMGVQNLGVEHSRQGDGASSCLLPTKGFLWCSVRIHECKSRVKSIHASGKLPQHLWQF